MTTLRLARSTTRSVTGSTRRNWGAIEMKTSGIAGGGDPRTVLVLNHEVRALRHRLGLGAINRADDLPFLVVPITKKGSGIIGLNGDLRGRMGEGVRELQRDEPHTGFSRGSLE